MINKNIKIVADSSVDIKELVGTSFSVAPLKITVGEREFLDNGSLDTAEMCDTLAAYKGKAHTSCPNREDYLLAFGEAEWVFCITMTSKLSGSYNAARLAKDEYESLYPTRRVTVIDSLSTGAEMVLIIEKIQGLISEGLSFDEITYKALEYTKATGLIFMLESLNNLKNSGRVNPVVAKMAVFLGIRLVGRADDGELMPISKCRGEACGLFCILDSMKKDGYGGGRVKITHCLNPGAANRLRELISGEYPRAEIGVHPMGGLTSFYAERGGLIVGFEKGTKSI